MNSGENPNSIVDSSVTPLLDDSTQSATNKPKAEPLESKKRKDRPSVRPSSTDQKQKIQFTATMSDKQQILGENIKL
jgi:hypothetical protein